jgi:formylglycine-generating enzyme required for sulfatase activity
MREEEHLATRQVFFSLEFSEDGFRVPAQREPCCAASRDNLGCLVTTSVDEFEPNGYKLHTVSGNYWEWYSKCTHSSFHLRNAAQTKAADFSMRKVRG